VAAAARLVARSAARAGRPLVVGLHGHGEPLADRRRIEEMASLCRFVAADAGLELVLACTTSGVLEPGDAEWLAATFDQVTVSHDGPGRLHDRQRPLAGGGGSSHLVEQTLEILSTAPRRPAGLAVRVTVTRASAPHQAAIVAFLLDHFAVDRLLLEPVYPAPGRARSAVDELRPDPIVMARGLLEARREAARRSVEVVLAGCRVDELHGRHCAILQRNLLLTPEGHATACFLDPGNDPGLSDRLSYGAYDAAADRLVLDHDRLAQLLDQAFRPSADCLGCFNLLHCAQGCPTVCPLGAPPAPPAELAGACELARRVGLATLLEAAGLEPVPDELESLG
jgi:sulfatase maturation enzyme AslB (radical SAM superfamily)